jgi:hypothetical protein
VLLAVIEVEFSSVDPAKPCLKNVRGHGIISSKSSATTSVALNALDAASSSGSSGGDGCMLH